MSISSFVLSTVLEGEALPPTHYLIDGHFTLLHPGSQQERLWVGFGAGKSKTCMAGKVTDQTGKDLADFDNCRVGTWWGGSEGEVRNDSRASGKHNLRPHAPLGRRRLRRLTMRVAP